MVTLEQDGVRVEAANVKLAGKMLTKELHRIAAARSLAYERAYATVGVFACNKHAGERVTAEHLSRLVSGDRRVGWEVRIAACHGDAVLGFSSSNRPIAVYEQANGTTLFVETQDETDAARVNSIFAVGVADGIFRDDFGACWKCDAKAVR